MNIDQLKGKGCLKKRKRFERKEKKPTGERTKVAELEALSENNMKAKASIVTELVEMGFSLESIERILRIKSKTLDRLL